MHNPRFWALTCLTLAVAMTRLIPHPYNFTPVGALALFGGAYFARKWAAFAVPLAAMVVSDVAMAIVASNTEYLWSQPPTYLSFALIVCIGLLLRSRPGLLPIALAAVAAAVLHALITDFAVWALLGFYPKTWSGLMACYAAGLPFFKNMLAGNLVFCGILFGAFTWAQKRFPALQENGLAANLSA